MADSVPKLARNTEKKKKNHRGPMVSLIPDPKYPPGDVKVTSHCPCAKGVLPLLSLRLVPTTLGYSQCFWPRGHSFLQFGHAVFPRNGWFWRERARRLHGLAETPGDRALGNDARCGSPDGGCVWCGSWPFMDGIIKKKKALLEENLVSWGQLRRGVEGGSLTLVSARCRSCCGRCCSRRAPIPPQQRCVPQERPAAGWLEGRTFGEKKDLWGSQGCFGKEGPSGKEGSFGKDQGKR